MSPKICNICKNCKNLLLLLTTCFKLAIAAGWAIRYSRTSSRVSSTNLTFKQFSRSRLNVLTLQFYLFCSRLLLSSSPPSVCFKLNRLRALKKHSVSHQPNSLLVFPSYSVELRAIWNLCKNQVFSSKLTLPYKQELPCLKREKACM